MKKSWQLCHPFKNTVLTKSFNQPIVLIWDSDGEPPEGNWVTVLWRDYNTKGRNDVVSIPCLVEENSENLRRRYLRWIHGLCETKVNGKKIVDHLEIRPGLSYWWMTLLAEKCNVSKSPQIADAIKLLAFDEWARSKRFKKLALTTGKAVLASILRCWCRKTNINFQWQNVEKDAGFVFLPRDLYQSIPHLAVACISLLRHLIQGWSLRGSGLKEWRETKGQVTFISYLFNLVSEPLKEGIFESRYWAHLPDVLARNGCHTNWLQLYVKSEVFPAPKKAGEAIRVFNKTGKGTEVHVTLDSFLSGGVVFRVLRDCIRLAFVGRRLKAELSFAINSSLDFGPLFQRDWDCSMAGHTAMKSVLYLNLIEEALKVLPKQRVGVYLQENQAWEFALLHAWRRAGHGRLIGVPHSTVRFWDLRYFYDPRCYKRTGYNDLPMPDQVALNGPAMMHEYQMGGYPSSQFVEVEALRYLQLKKKPKPILSTYPSNNKKVRVLVLGDYLCSNTHQMIIKLEKALKFLPSNLIFVLKPHPNCPIKPKNYPKLKMRLAMESVTTLLVNCDVAYTSAVTSAAVDAYCVGVPVVTVLDPKQLNLSPIRKYKGVYFASTPEEIANSILFAAATKDSTKMRAKIFNLSNSIVKWKKLLIKK